MVVRASYHQDILDVAIQYYGSVQHAYTIADINDVSLTAEEINRLLYVTNLVKFPACATASNVHAQPVSITITVTVSSGSRKKSCSYKAEQTLFDVAIITSADVAKAMTLAAKNNISINSDATQVTSRSTTMDLNHYHCLLLSSYQQEDVEVATNITDLNTLTQYALYVATDYALYNYIDRKKIETKNYTK